METKDIPAFPMTTSRTPLSDGTTVYDGPEGMTLRDYFAAKALPACIAAAEENANANPADVSSDAYAYADAMLRARDAK